jgi:hypothetical protein
LEYELKKLKEKKAPEMSRKKTKHEVQVKEPVQEIQEQSSRPAVTLPATRLSNGACDETMTKESGLDYRGCQDHTMSGTPCMQWDSVTAKHLGVIEPKHHIRGHNYCRNYAFLLESSIYCYTSPTEYELCRPKGDGGFVGGDD